jgi:clostripain
MSTFRYLLPFLIAAPTLAQAPAELRPWTLLVYGGADNNADGPILDFLHDVRTAIDDDPGIELLLLIDRSEEFSDDARFLGEDFTGARLYRITKDSAERLSGGEQFPELSEGDAELDSADAYNVRRFVDWGKANYPARHYGLMIYSHASGRTMCPDEESGRDMGIPELGEVMGEAQSLDFLALELCNMAGVEIGYEWRPEQGRWGADVLVAIPNAGPPLDWDRAFARIRSKGHDASPLPGPHLDPATMTAADFGRLVIEEGRRGRELALRERPERISHEAAGCFDLRHAREAKQAIDAVAVALANDSRDARDFFGEMRGPGPIGDAMNFGEGSPLVDAYDLFRRVADCDAFSDDVRARSEDAKRAIDALVVSSFGMQGYEGFEDGKNGIFLITPTNEPAHWKGYRWYTPLAYDDGGKDYGRWSFLADGATPGNGRVENWFELLDFWFDEVDDGGGVNGYAF